MWFLDFKEIKEEDCMTNAMLLLLWFVTLLGGGWLAQFVARRSYGELSTAS